MSFWNIFSNKSEEYAKIGAEILDRHRAGYYPVNSIEKPIEQVMSTSKVTFDVIQNTIKEEIEKVTKNIEQIDEKDIKIKLLIEQLEAFKKDNELIYKKINDLKSVGLVNTPSSKELLSKLQNRELDISYKISEIKDEIKKIKNINDAIKKYALEYPSFKFIDTKTFTDILKKYSLVLGDSSLYCKEIPDNVLSNIVKFKDKINASKKYIHVIERYDTSFRYRQQSFHIISHSSELYNNGFPNYFSNDFNINERSIYKYCKTDLVIAAPLNHFNNEIVRLMKLEDKGSSHTVNIPVFTVNENTREFVVDQTALDTLTASNNTISKQIDDPIACLRVPEGFIIIDAWDKEALIPELNRENLN